jgi:type II secretory pathway component PulF
MAVGAVHAGQLARPARGVVVLGVAAAARAARGRRRRRQALARDPAQGTSILTQESARFFTVMAALSRSGVPVADAIAVAANAISHPDAPPKQFDRLRVKLVEGGVLPRLIDGRGRAAGRDAAAADRGGPRGRPGHRLRLAGRGHGRPRWRPRRSGCWRRSSPLLIVLLFVMIGSLVLSIMVPMITMSTQVS